MVVGGKEKYKANRIPRKVGFACYFLIFSPKFTRRFWTIRRHMPMLSEAYRLSGFIRFKRR